MMRSVAIDSFGRTLVWCQIRSFCVAWMRILTITNVLCGELLPACTACFLDGLNTYEAKDGFDATSQSIFELFVCAMHILVPSLACLPLLIYHIMQLTLFPPACQLLIFFFCNFHFILSTSPCHFQVLQRIIIQFNLFVPCFTLEFLNCLFCLCVLLSI